MVVTALVREHPKAPSDEESQRVEIPSLNENVGASIARPAVKQEGITPVSGEFETITLRTTNGRPYK